MVSKLQQLLPMEPYCNSTESKCCYWFLVTSFYTKWHFVNSFKEMGKCLKDTGVAKCTLSTLSKYVNIDI
jgi:hypothetical protein